MHTSGTNKSDDAYGGRGVLGGKRDFPPDPDFSRVGIQVEYHMEPFTFLMEKYIYEHGSKLSRIFEFLVREHCS